MGRGRLWSEGGYRIREVGGGFGVNKGKRKGGDKDDGVRRGGVGGVESGKGGTG